MGNQYWFKPKTYGYGATPITWEGWAVVGGHFALMSICFFVMIYHEDNLQLIGICLAIMALATVAMLKVSKAKTDGQWNWRSNAGK